MLKLEKCGWLGLEIKPMLSGQQTGHTNVGLKKQASVINNFIKKDKLNK